MDIETLRKRLEEDSRAGRLEQVAVESGVPFRTVRKIRYGETSNPRIDTFSKLVAHYSESGPEDGSKQ